MKFEQIKEIYETISVFEAPKVDFNVITPTEITEKMNECLRYVEQLYSFSVDIRKDISKLSGMVNDLEDDYKATLDDYLFNDPKVQFQTRSLLYPRYLLIILFF